VQFGAAATDPLAKAHDGLVTVDASKTLSGADALAFGQASKLRRPYLSAITAKAASNKRVLETVNVRKICATFIGRLSHHEGRAAEQFRTPGAFISAAVIPASLPTRPSDTRHRPDLLS
jgi:hypothetical protein